MSVAVSSVPLPDAERAEQAQTRLTGPLFPLTSKEATSQWWSNLSPNAAERNVLQLIPHIKEHTGVATTPDHANQSDPYGPRVWQKSMVQLPGKNRGLNELSITRLGEEVEQTVVMIHGYGAGLGFFYKNFEPLSRAPGRKLFALDMLGMGNSKRPRFKIRAARREEQTTEAENWFIDALEEWRIARNIEKFVLLGHSLGGYLSVSYALKFPGHVEKLILVSPAGIPEDPYAMKGSQPKAGSTFHQRNSTQDEQTAEANNNGIDDGTDSAEPNKPLPGWLVCLWNANISPFSLIRMTGPLGPKLASGWTHRRFNHLPSTEFQVLHEYSFSIFRQKGSGEYAMPYILAPGAHARRPIIRRIQEVGRQRIQGEPNGLAKETGIPIIFMYGENDWMDVAGGEAAVEKLNLFQLEALRQGKRDNGEAKLIMVSNAGHNLYLDNPDEFNSKLYKELGDTRVLLGGGV
ncbi:putative alpha/beta hydrolase [Ilyonectria destructans]|nr:putative alpha/beta hydrolase [Ilyonectria destructans]